MIDQPLSSLPVPTQSPVMQILDAPEQLRFNASSCQPVPTGTNKCPLPLLLDPDSDDVRWLSALPYTLSFPSMGFIVVHAGLVPGMPLKRQDTTAMSCMRNVVESETGSGYEPRVNAKEGTMADTNACWLTDLRLGGA